MDNDAELKVRLPALLKSRLFEHCGRVNVTPSAFVRGFIEVALS